MREPGLAISVKQDIPFNKAITQQNLKKELFFILIDSGEVIYILPDNLPTEIIDTPPPTTGADTPACGDEGVIVITPPTPDDESTVLSKMRNELHDDMSSGYLSASRVICRCY